MATVDQLNRAFSKSGLSVRAKVEGNTCFFSGTELRIDASNLNQMTIPKWVETVKKVVKANGYKSVPNPAELLRNLQQQLVDAKRTGDKEDQQEIEDAIQELKTANPQLKASMQDAYAKADVIQGVLTSQLHIDTMVEEAKENFVVVTMTRPVPLPSVIIALSKGNMTLVQVRAKQKIKYGSDIVLTYRIPSQDATVMLFLDAHGCVSVIGVS